MSEGEAGEVAVRGRAVVLVAVRVGPPVSFIETVDGADDLQSHVSTVSRAAKRSWLSGMRIFGRPAERVDVARLIPNGIPRRIEIAAAGTEGVALTPDGLTSKTARVRWSWYGSRMIVSLSDVSCAAARYRDRAAGPAGSAGRVRRAARASRTSGPDVDRVRIVEESNLRALGRRCTIDRLHLRERGDRRRRGPRGFVETPVDHHRAGPARGMSDRWRMRVNRSGFLRACRGARPVQDQRQ